MTLLLDSHVWIWSQEAPEKFGRRTRALLEDASNGVAISAMAVMEVALLFSGAFIWRNLQRPG